MMCTISGILTHLWETNVVVVLDDKYVIDFAGDVFDEWVTPTMAQEFWAISTSGASVSIINITQLFSIDNIYIHLSKAAWYYFSVVYLTFTSSSTVTM